MSTSGVLSIIQTEFSRYSSLLTIVGGVFGNVCILILFSRRWQNSCGLCLLCAAVFNSLNLIVNVWSRVSATFGPDVTSLNVDLCKLRFYSGHVWSQVGRYMVGFACIDRYLLSANNARFQIISQPVVIRCIIGGIVVFWHVAGIHVVVLTKIENGLCGQYGVYTLIYFVYTLIVASFIPLLLMMVFGLLAYRSMKRLHARIRPIGNLAAGNNDDTIVNRRDRDLLNMVLAESAVYVSTNFLFPMINLEIATTNHIGLQKSPLYQQIENFLFSLGSVLIYFNNAVPFYTYLAASKTFRKDTKVLFGKLWHRLIEWISLSISISTNTMYLKSC